MITKVNIIPLLFCHSSASCPNSAKVVLGGKISIQCNNQSPSQLKSKMSWKRVQLQKVSQTGNITSLALEDIMKLVLYLVQLFVWKLREISFMIKMWRELWVVDVITPLDITTNLLGSNKMNEKKYKVLRLEQTEKDGMQRWKQSQLVMGSASLENDGVLKSLGRLST